MKTQVLHLLLGLALIFSINNVAGDPLTSVTTPLHSVLRPDVKINSVAMLSAALASGTVGHAAGNAGARLKMMSNDATLSALTISSGTLNPVFAAGTTSYTASVGNGVASVTVTPTTNDPSATVTVNGIVATSGTSSGLIALNVGSNKIITKVTAQDGVTTKTYTTTVTRESRNADLSALTISSGTLSPVFASATQNYTASVGNSVASVMVTPTTSDPSATGVTVDGATVTSGTASGPVPLNVGSNTITIIVTAHDPSFTKTYTITVTRESRNANLSALTISSSTLSPVFAGATQNYTASVGNGVASVMVTPTTSDPSATGVTVDGTTVTSGTASGAVPLNVGSNTITIIVTARDPSFTKTYTITVTRESRNADLSALTISSGTLSPVFAGAMQNYMASVGNSVASVMVTPTASDPSATGVTVNGTAVTSGTASGAVPLNVGSNTITIIVTARDPSFTKTYTITVTRESRNADLSALTISSGTLSPVFAGATQNYTASVGNGVASVMVTPTTSDPSATGVTVDGTTVTSGTASGAVPLNVGSNTITIIVTARDPSFTKTYTITVTRESRNADLSALTISSGTLSPVFAGATQNYTASVGNGVVSVMVTPTTSDPSATGVTVDGTAVTSGTASGAVPLNVGANTITVIVSANDPSFTKTYTITVTRAGTGAGTSYVWTGAGLNQNWDNSANWSPSTGFPVAGDAATIGTTVNTPVVNISSTCSSVVITGGTTITLSAALTVSSGVTLNASLTTSGAGGVVVSGILTINTGGSLTNSSPFTLNNGSINMLDNAYITNSGIFNLSGTAITMGKSGYISNGTAGTFTINGGSSVDFAANSADAASIMNSGIFYAGTSNSACTLNLNYSDAAINNTGTFYLGSTSVINLTGNAANIGNTGTFTLQSDVNGCATIGNISGVGAGCFGTYNVERYLSGGSVAYRSYRALSSPVYETAESSGGNNFNVYSINYVANTAPTTGSGGVAGGFTQSGNPTFYLYRDNIAPSNATFTGGNFRGIASLSGDPSYAIDAGDPASYIPVGNGFLFFDRGNKTGNKFVPGTVAESITLTATGTLNTGSVTVTPWFSEGAATLDYTPVTGNSGVQGYALAGNPYASSIDWDLFGSAITGTNVDPAIYILDPLSLNYDVYIAGNHGVGNKPGTASNIIPSGQGFFVRANSTGAALTFTEAAKTNTQATPLNGNLFLGKPIQAAVMQYFLIQLSKDSINTEGMLVNFKSNASPDYVAGEDAKHKVGNGIVHLSSISPNDIDLSINTLPLPKLTPDNIPLLVNVQTSGTYQLTMPEIKSIPDLYDIWLMDAYKKDSLDIKHNPTYTFDVDKSDTSSFGAHRFSLVIRQDTALMVHLLSFGASKTTGGASIVWTTENEQNYTYFAVERSSDGGITFNVVGSVASSAQGSYSFLDENPPIATDMYRLKTTDLNGTISYSNVVTLMYANTTNQVAVNNLTLYPNPTVSTINLSIDNSQAGENKPAYDIEIVNNMGSVIKKSASSSPLWQSDVSTLAPGTYFITVINTSTDTLVGKSTFVKL